MRYSAIEARFERKIYRLAARCARVNLFGTRS